MKRNNKQLYDSIMRNVSKQVRNALNEDVTNPRNVFATLHIEFSTDIVDDRIYAYISNDEGSDGVELSDMDTESLSEKVKEYILKYMDVNIE